MSDARDQFLNRQAQEGESQGAPAQGEPPVQAEGVASPEASQGETSIPYSRFKQVNDQKKLVAEELESARRQMADLQAELEQVKAEERARQYRDQLGDLPDETKDALLGMQRDVEQRAAPKPDPNAGMVARQATEWQLFKQTGHQFSDEQVDVVMEIRSENPKLRDATELLFLAQRRDPSLFQGWEIHGGSSHFVQPAGAGREEQGRAQKIDELQASWMMEQDPTRKGALLSELLKARFQDI